MHHISREAKAVGFLIKLNADRFAGAAAVATAIFLASSISINVLSAGL